MKNILKFGIILAFGVTGTWLLMTGLSTKSEIHFGYKESGDISYSVTQTNGEKISSDQVYFTDLLDKINARYKYHAKFTEKVNGEYAYRFVAELSANHGEDEKYWTKTIELSDIKKGKLSDSKTLSINEKIDIDYQEYNAMLSEFKNEFRDDAKGTLKVSMYINGNFVTQIDADRMITLSSESSITAPLAEESIRIETATDAKNSGKLFTKEIDIDNWKYLFSRIAGVGLIVLDIILISKIIFDTFIYRRRHQKEITVKKLLSSYDNIIVEISEAPRIKSLHMADVKKFDELLDVYNSIKAPINYYENENEYCFILISENLAWRYVITKDVRRKSSRVRRSGSHTRKNRSRK